MTGTTPSSLSDEWRMSGYPRHEPELRSVIYAGMLREPDLTNLEQSP
jgi:hypothetical protein